MARKTTGEPVGRPIKEIDWEQFEQLCAIQCTTSEISSVLKICEDTLYYKVKEKYGEHFSVIYKKYSEEGKSSLRRIQFKLAFKNTAMAIWLGKQWLDQKDTNIKDIREASKEGVIDAIREIENERTRTDEACRSSLEAEQPLLDKGFQGEENQIPDELGTTTAL